MPNNSPQLPSQWLPEPSRTTRSLSRELARTSDNTELAVARVQGEVVKSAAVIRGVEYLGHEAYRSIESLARHEARAASADPFIADEYAYLRRVVTSEIAQEIQDFRRGGRR